MTNISDNSTKPQNRTIDLISSLKRQFRKIMTNKQCGKVVDERLADGTFDILPNRYERGGRIYQMQVDFCYLIRRLTIDQRNSALIHEVQAFINACRDELSGEKN